MSKAFLEIIELPDGRIVLRRSEEEGPMVTLTFSKDTKAFLRGRYIDVAKAMFHAGLETAGQLVGEMSEDDELELDDEQPTLH